MQFKAFLLREGRIETLKDMFWDKIRVRIQETNNRVDIETTARFVWQMLVESDPTPKKIYLQWMANQYVSGRLLVEDLYKVKDDLTIFERVKHLIPADQRDIGRYKTPKDLYDVVRRYENEQSKNDLKREEIARFKAEITTVYDGPEGKIFIPQTWNAAKYLGRGTRWCTSSEHSDANFFAYTRGGVKLFIFITPDGTKTQANLGKYDEKWYANFQGAGMTAQYANAADHTLPLAQLGKHPLFKKMLESREWAAYTLTPSMESGDKKAIELFLNNTPALKRLMSADAKEVIEMAHRLPPKWKKWVEVFKVAVGT